MNTISITYTLIWQFKDYPHLQVTKCRKVFNVKKGTLLKQCMNGGSIGYWLDAKTFVVKNNINGMLEKIPNSKCPF